MGLKEELAEIKKNKLSLQLPPAEALPRADGVALQPVSPAQPVEKIISLSQEAAAPKKTIPQIASEILGEKSGQGAAGEAVEEFSLPPARKHIAPAAPVILEDNVFKPPAAQGKTIPEIAAEIIAEKQAAPAKSVEEMIEVAGKVGEKKEGEEEKRSGEESGDEEKESVPRKPLPAIAEEIRREMGVIEKKEPGLPEPPAPPYATSPIPTEMVDRLAEAKQSALSTEPKRLYLLKPEERGETRVERGEREVQYSPHQRIYQQRGGRQEKGGGEPGFDEMVSEVYVQVKRKEEKERPLLQEEKREEAESEKKRREEEARKQFEQRRHEREARKHSQEPRKEEPSAVPQSVSIEELLGEKPGEEKKATGLFSELEKEAAGSGGKNLFGELEEASKPSSAKKQAEFTVVEREKGCPNCKNSATKIVYCPYCGGAMCANCSAKITPYPDHFTYVCPHCSEEVEVKKKAA